MPQRQNLGSQKKKKKEIGSLKIGRRGKEKEKDRVNKRGGHVGEKGKKLEKVEDSVTVGKTHRESKREWVKKEKKILNRESGENRYRGSSEKGNIRVKGIKEK